MPLKPGSRVGAYEIVTHLGGGGMGLVYQVRDTRLDRFAALKFLPPALTRDETAKQRFVQEAKAASALDHANICTIYDIGETDDGELYLVMAFYEGETLKQHIGRGPLPIDDALDIAIEVAQGLAKAHSSGIVHRDIKPANLMLTSDAQIKIVDFGLAKLVGHTGITQTGTTLGTVSYMSPEQVRGEEVDGRSDLWSLGVVLYEMMCGQLPFKGDSAAVVSTAILQQDPQPLTALRTGVPMELERVVNRLLAKDAKDRYQTAADILSELRLLRRKSDDELATMGMPSRAAAPGKSSHWRRWVVPGLLLAATGLAGYWLGSDRPSGDVTFELANPVQVTTSLGIESQPDWSPDGQTIAYSANRSIGTFGGGGDILVKQVGGGPPVNVTDEKGNDQYPVWSPNGRQIAFSSSREGGGYFVVPALGGAVRKIRAYAAVGFMANTQGKPQWSADGSQLAVVVYDATGSPQLEIVSLDTNASRQLPLPGKGIRRYQLAWSPDGQHFAYVAGSSPTDDVNQLWALRLADQEAHPITDGRTVVWSPSWSSDGRSLYFVSNQGGGLDLWRQSIAPDGTPKGAAEAVTTGAGIRKEMAFSRDGKRFAYTRGGTIENVWRVPIQENDPATWEEAEQLTFDSAYIQFLEVSSDGERLLLSSDRTGNFELWTVPVAGGDMLQLTTDPTPDWLARWSPDERHIAFYAYRSGNRDVWVMPVEGGPARQLTTHEARDANPAWSPDGSRIAFSSERSGNRDLWVVAAEGGTPQQLTREPGYDEQPRYSPDGDRLAFVSSRAARDLSVWVMPAEGGEPEVLSGNDAYFPMWSADGSDVYFIRRRRATGDIWRVSVRDRRERQMTALAGRAGGIGTYGLAVDAHYIYFTWREDLGDIWVMDVIESSSR